MKIQLVRKQIVTCQSSYLHRRESKMLLTNMNVYLSWYSILKANDLFTNHYNIYLINNIWSDWLKSNSLNNTSHKVQKTSSSIYLVVLTSFMILWNCQMDVTVNVMLKYNFPSYKALLDSHLLYMAKHSSGMYSGAVWPPPWKYTSTNNYQICYIPHSHCIIVCYSF